MGCLQSKPQKDQEIKQALERIKEKEHAIDELIKQHEQIIYQSQKQMQPGQKIEIEEDYKQKINQRFDQLEKNLEKFNSDGFRLNTNSNNNNGKEGNSKSPSTLMQRQPPNNNNNNNGNILFTEDIQVNSKNVIQSPPISISPNQLPNQMQLQRESSQQSQPVTSSQHIQHQQSLPQNQQQQQQIILQQQQQQQQQLQQSLKKQQLFENGIHQQQQLQQQQQAAQEQMIFSQAKNKHPSRKSSDHRITSPKRISMGSNGKIIKQSKANNNNNPNQVEDDMQHWNNIIQALDDISIRPIDQFNENQPQQKNIIPSTDVLDFDITTGKQKSNNNVLSQLNSQTLPAQPQQQKNFSGVNSHEIQAVNSHNRPKTSGAAVPLDQIILNNPELNKIHQKVSNAILKNP